MVLLDPVACLLHQATTTSEFVCNSLYSLEDATMDYIFKKELWSAIMVSRHLAWHEGEWWLDDCTKQVLGVGLGSGLGVGLGSGLGRVVARRP